MSSMWPWLAAIAGAAAIALTDGAAAPAVMEAEGAGAGVGAAGTLGLTGVAGDTAAAAAPVVAGAGEAASAAAPELAASGAVAPTAGAASGFTATSPAMSAMMGQGVAPASYASQVAPLGASAGQLSPAFSQALPITAQTQAGIQATGMAPGLAGSSGGLSTDQALRAFNTYRQMSAKPQQAAAPMASPDQPRQPAMTQQQISDKYAEQARLQRLKLIQQYYGNTFPGSPQQGNANLGILRALQGGG